VDALQRSYRILQYTLINYLASFVGVTTNDFC